MLYFPEGIGSARSILAGLGGDLPFLGRLRVSVHCLLRQKSWVLRRAGKSVVSHSSGSPKQAETAPAGCCPKEKQPSRRGRLAPDVALITDKMLGKETLFCPTNRVCPYSPPDVQYPTH